jgi:hypothetical protein
MNGELGTEVAQFLLWEYINKNFFACGIGEKAVGGFKKGLGGDTVNRVTQKSRNRKKVTM